eukprot:1161305-Pelagomonas_calceolata.AAC.10
MCTSGLLASVARPARLCFGDSVRAHNLTHNRSLSSLSLYPSLDVYPRPAGERGVPRALVPLEALHASERMREDAETARADIQASLVCADVDVRAICQMDSVHSWLYALASLVCGAVDVHSTSGVLTWTADALCINRIGTTGSPAPCILCYCWTECSANKSSYKLVRNIVACEEMDHIVACGEMDHIAA